MNGSERTRVLWLTKGLGPGGAERLLVEHARSSIDQPDLEFTAAYLLPWKQHLVPELEAVGVRTVCLGVRSEADVRWLGGLRSLLRDLHIDVVHAHSPVSASMARPWIRTIRPRRPGFVYTEHNRWSSHRPPTRLANDATYGLNDSVFAVSDAVRESVPLRWRTKVETVVHGIDVEGVRSLETSRDDVRTELGIADTDILAVTVANLRANKDYPTLLAAARSVAESGSPITFVAVGQGPLEEELRRERARLGLDSTFRFLGYRDDARRIIAAADLFVLASAHEGLPVAVMEALALGVPVVATAVGGLPEMVVDGDNGLLVPAGDPDALAVAIRRLEDAGFRAGLAEGAGRSADRYSIGTAVAYINDRYRSLARSAA